MIETVVAVGAFIFFAWRIGKHDMEYEDDPTDFE